MVDSPQYGHSSLLGKLRSSNVFFVIPDTVVPPYRAGGFNGFNGLFDSLRSSIVIYISLI